VVYRPQFTGGLVGEGDPGRGSGAHPDYRSITELRRHHDRGDLKDFLVVAFLLFGLWVDQWRTSELERQSFFAACHERHPESSDSTCADQRGQVPSLT
jgi:hypothetical protein